MRWIVEDTMVSTEFKHLATVASSDNADGFRIVEARNAEILKDLCNQLRPIVEDKGDLEASLRLVQALSVTEVPC